jgi:hypothetical protein
MFSKAKRMIYRIKCELMYRKATAAAEKMASKDGCIYFVLPTESGKLMVLNHDQYLAFRKVGLTPVDARPKDLFRDCLYHTNCHSEKAKQSRKRKFLRWKGLA